MASKELQVFYKNPLKNSIELQLQFVIDFMFYHELLDKLFINRVTKRLSDIFTPKTICGMIYRLTIVFLTSTGILKQIVVENDTENK